MAKWEPNRFQLAILTGVAESLEDWCVRAAGGNSETIEGMMRVLPISIRRHPARRAGRGRRRWALAGALAALVLLLAPAAAAQPPGPDAPAAAPGLSGPTIRLFKAVELNDMAAVKASIEDGAELEAENEDGMTPADLAVDRGHFIIAHYLLSQRLLRQEQPVALVPGKAGDAAAAKAKRRFAQPPEKPSPPQPPAAPGAEEAPAEAPATPAPPEPAETVAEAPAGEGAPPGPAETMAEAPAGEAAPSGPAEIMADTPAGEEAPAPDRAEKPLADEGVAEFFQSLVELITPGGEKPPPVPGAEAQAPGAPEAKAPPPPEEAIVETTVEQSDEVVVEVTESPAAPPEIVEETAPPVDVTLEEADLETVTAEPEPQPGEEAAEAPAEPAPEAKPEESLLDRMAGLFTGDKEAEGAPAPETAEAKAPAPEKPARPDGGPAAPAAPAAPPPPAAEGEITAYELPLPPPEPDVARKFSPRFLDRLAEFLESGDEEAFKAWLPEMQIMSADSGYIRRPLSPRAGGAPTAPAGPPEAPAPEKAPVAPVEEAGLPAPPPPEETAEAPPVPPRPEAPTAAAAAPPPNAETLAPVVDKGAPPPAPPETPGVIEKAFDKVAGALTPDAAQPDRPERLVLEPEERLAAAGEAPAPAEKPGDAADKAEPGELPPKYWPITEVETAEAPPVQPRPEAPTEMLKTSLTGVTLSLGESVTLENTYPPMGLGVDPHNRCVKKNRGTTLFCLEPVDWPEPLRADFLVPTILYTGHKAIARYDQGIASRFHALFPSDAFERVVRYFHGRFGEPTDAWNRSIAPFAQPRQDNPTLAWRSKDPETGVVTVLEIRKYDDTRGGFPDTNRGAVMLYLANSPPIFPQVSSHELMRLSRRRMAEPAAAVPEAAPMGAPAGEPPGAMPGMSEGAAPAEEDPMKRLQNMTSEEIQAERRRKKAAEEGGAPPGEAEPFGLPPDPLGR